jgi:co-chaperonin GroES (HSP10)
MLKAIQDRLVVEPYYDPEKIGSFYIPDSAKNPEAQQGVVKSVGPHSEIREGAYVFFPPFRSLPLQGTDLISIRDKDVVAFLRDGELYPPWEHYMVLPDWDSKYRQKSEWIYIPPTVMEDYSPVKYGTIIRCAEGTELPPNTKVVIAPGKGNEIGFKDTVYYFIHHDDILATVDANNH